jgi:protocatechuate 3,4-dioxygenase alpha subunit
MSSLTPSQTIGPFFRVLVPERGALVMAAPEALGTRITVTGKVLDGSGAGVPDALLEVWQANAEGGWNHLDDSSGSIQTETFWGFGRISTDAEGRFTFETVKPGSVPGPDNEVQAPHLVVGVFARGLLTRLVTRIYFSDEAANVEDPILRRVPVVRCPTLIAEHRDERYHLDIVLQGERETVFFDV